MKFKVWITYTFQNSRNEQFSTFSVSMKSCFAKEPRNNRSKSFFLRRKRKTWNEDVRKGRFMDENREKIDIFHKWFFFYIFLFFMIPTTQRGIFQIRHRRTKYMRLMFTAHLFRSNDSHEWFCGPYFVCINVVYNLEFALFKTE